MADDQTSDLKKRVDNLEAAVASLASKVAALSGSFERLRNDVLMRRATEGWRD